jgi:hypothetical protein
MARPEGRLMSAPVYRITSLLSTLLGHVPVGTNLALFHVLWTLVTGRLLAARGAIIPALADTGLPPDAVRRAWAALAYGQWQLAPMLAAGERVITAEGGWQPHQHAGYRPVACDLVGFFRPCLRGCRTTHFSQAAGQRVTAIPYGLVGRVGSVGGQRVPVLCRLVRAEEDDPLEEALQQRLLTEAAALLAEGELLLTDRGFLLSQIEAAHVPRYVARMPKNFIARRATLPPYGGRGRPATHGEIVRPLARQYNGRTLPATAPDREEAWEEDGHTLRAHFWDHLIRADGPQDGPTFTCAVLFDPRYKKPWVLVSPLSLSGAAYRALYPDRWPVEQIPLAAKQMLGAEHQFVFAPECRQRLPELAMVAGALLIYAAATQPALPSGFWDRAPRPTIGRLRRVLAHAELPGLAALPAPFRKKASPTAHLPKGVWGHRRHKATAIPTGATRCAA